MAQTEIKTQQLYSFEVEVDGLPAGILQTFKVPDNEITESKYGAGANVDVKVAGKRMISDATAKVLANDSTYFESWLDSKDKRLMVVKMLDNQGNVQLRYELENTWVKKIVPDELDKAADGTALMQKEITFSVENIVTKNS